MLPLLFTLLVGIVLGLVGWINQSLIADQWRWWTVTRPYAAAQVWPHVLTAAREQALETGDSFKECAIDCPEMIVVPAGSFTMGSPSTEKGRYPSEGPLHTVTFAQPFAVSKYEVTFADWDACVTGGGCNGYEPNNQGWGGGQQPVINVSWDDAGQYATWLSQVTGKRYRLPTEAEYEYATRAGTTTRYPWGDDIGTNNANCGGCGSKWDKTQTATVGSFAANKLDLHDMVGNVSEWTEDCIHVPDYNGAPTDGSDWITPALIAAAVSSAALPGPALRTSSALRPATGAPPSPGALALASGWGARLLHVESPLFYPPPPGGGAKLLDHFFDWSAIADNPNVVRLPPCEYPSTCSIICSTRMREGGHRPAPIRHRRGPPTADAPHPSGSRPAFATSGLSSRAAAKSSSAALLCPSAAFARLR